jgi:hypothetical protein
MWETKCIVEAPGHLCQLFFMPGQNVVAQKIQRRANLTRQIAGQAETGDQVLRVAIAHHVRILEVVIIETGPPQPHAVVIFQGELGIPGALVHPGAEVVSVQGAQWLGGAAIGLDAIDVLAQIEIGPLRGIALQNLPARGHVPLLSWIPASISLHFRSSAAMAWVLAPIASATSSSCPPVRTRML